MEQFNKNHFNKPDHLYHHSYQHFYQDVQHNHHQHPCIILFTIQNADTCHLVNVCQFLDITLRRPKHKIMIFSILKWSSLFQDEIRKESQPLES